MPFKNQKVGEIMSKNVETILPDTPIFEAVKILKNKNIGSLVIVENSKILGIFTERDLAYRVVAEEIDYKNTSVSSVMTKPVVTVAEDTSIEDAYLLTATRNIRHLPVVDKANRLIGMTGAKDILAEVLQKVLPI
ncbi:MAG: hypothetical protein A4S09_03755 [Proteobacteria bacterium SG_bin7]|nr:MAG: hypothetical protein A4S09_03755 [Proteobacteria bacterium SG_bin7]